jgi:hypothetical protein
MMTPSHPVGVVLHGSLLDILIHRSHLYDDEKGLDEVPLDTTTAKVRFLFERRLLNAPVRRGSIEIETRRRSALSGMILMKSANLATVDTDRKMHYAVKWFVHVLC